jgi:hypothetical protein
VGRYTVRVSNTFGSDTSAPAFLTIGARPAVTVPLQSQTVVEGDTVALSISVTGTVPFTFRWRHNNQFISNAVFVLSQSNCVFTIPSVRTNQAGTYNVVITNALGTILSPVAVLTVLRDTDQDRIPDVWESANGFNPDDGDDAALDTDDDRLTNLDEFRSGTNPRDANSRLQFTSFSVSSGISTLSFPAMSNKTYSVLYCESPADGTWLRLSNVAAVTTNRSMILIDPGPADLKRFYQLRTPQLP